jgi:DNA-binding MarR family transcriptional regulator
VGLSNDDYPFDSTSDYPAREIAAAWALERPGTPTSSIEVVTPLWRLAKLLGDDRRRVLAEARITPATLDLLSVLRRSGPPYTLDTRELAARTLVTAGAISQRVGKAEKDGLVTRGPGEARSVLVTLTEAGHALIERTVDQVLTREASLVDGLTDEQRRQLGELLDLLLSQVVGKT